MTAQLGFALRDHALAQSREGREAMIREVREAVLSRFRGVEWFTADDVHRVAESLGYGEGETRWLGHICKGWDAVHPLAHFVPSTRPERHGCPQRCWKTK